MKAGFRVAARGLIIQEDKLLFVSNEGYYWYLPGGRVEESETMHQCVEREVYEETGLRVKTGDLLYVLESFDLHDDIHKINFYFQATVLFGEISDSWSDTDNVVQHRRYFTLAEIQEHKTIIPRFLEDGRWLNAKHHPFGKIYQGCLTVRGFEMVDPA